MPARSYVKIALAIGVVSGIAIGAYGELNSEPNPYRTMENWAKLPKGMHFGQVISVDPDIDGKSIWVFHRAAPHILKFDAEGNFVKSLTDMPFNNAHGFCIDKEGNIWASDAAARNGRGQQVFKFSPEGKVLLTLGTAGVSGDSETTFNGVSDIAIAPNGDIFASDGHVNNRVMKFSPDGKFIKQWGKKGSGPGEFNVPHTLAFDSQGRLFVGDRSNSRIQIFDQDGKFLVEWKQFSRPSGIYITKDDTILVADSDSKSDQNPGWLRGIRIGSAKTGKVTALIPDTEAWPDSPEAWEGSGVRKSVSSGPEGVAMDAAGNVYGAEVGPMRLMRYVKR
jgi:DNA-binding beta-propeller fold protein YncE